MKARCRNKNSISYKNYGGRGINVCDEWLDFKTFYDWAISNGYDENLEIDRIDNNKNYEPNNCRWVTKTFNRKHKRKASSITINGITDTFTGWCKRVGIGRTI